MDNYVWQSLITYKVFEIHVKISQYSSIHKYVSNIMWFLFGSSYSSRIQEVQVSLFNAYTFRTIVKTNSELMILKI